MLDLTVNKARQIQRASETDTAFGVTPLFGTIIGQALEFDTALALTHARTMAIGRASETDQALALAMIAAVHTLPLTVIVTDPARLGSVSDPARTLRII